MEIILLIIIISIAFGAEAVFGFGAGLISVAAISIIIGVKDAVTFVLIFQLLMGLLIFKNYKSISWRAASIISGGLIIGTIIGTFTLSSLNPKLLQAILAIAIVLFLIKMKFFNNVVLKRTPGKFKPGLIGSMAGILQGLIGTGGQILMMYLPGIINDKARLRATLIYLFFITSVVRIIISVPEGLLSEEILKNAVIVLPFFLLSIILGQRYHGRVNDRYYQLAIYVFLTISALALSIKTIT